MAEQDKGLEKRRAKVRIWVTYVAALFVFVGAAAMIAYALIIKDNALAKDIFFAVLPVGAAVISYWFAGRSAEKVARQNGGE